MTTDLSTLPVGGLGRPGGDRYLAEAAFKLARTGKLAYTGLAGGFRNRAGGSLRRSALPLAGAALLVALMLLPGVALADYSIDTTNPFNTTTSLSSSAIDSGLPIFRALLFAGLLGCAGAAVFAPDRFPWKWVGGICLAILIVVSGPSLINWTIGKLTSGGSVGASVVGSNSSGTGSTTGD